MILLARDRHAMIGKDSSDGESPSEPWAMMKIGAAGVGTLSSRLGIRRRAERRLDRSHKVVDLKVASMSDLGGLWSIAHDDEAADHCVRQQGHAT